MSSSNQKTFKSTSNFSLNTPKYSDNMNLTFSNYTHNSINSSSRKNNNLVPETMNTSLNNSNNSINSSLVSPNILNNNNNNFTNNLISPNIPNNCNNVFFGNNIHHMSPVSISSSSCSSNNSFHSFNNNINNNNYNNNNSNHNNHNSHNNNNNNNLISGCNYNSLINDILYPPVYINVNNNNINNVSLNPLLQPQPQSLSSIRITNNNTISEINNILNEHKLQIHVLKQQIKKLEKQLKTAETSKEKQQNKKQNCLKIIHKFGFSNKGIRQHNNDFKYSCEIRDFKVSTNVTIIDYSTKSYYIGTPFGTKVIHFTNSSNERFNIKLLHVAVAQKHEEKNKKNKNKNKNKKPAPKPIIIDSIITKGDRSFATIFDPKDNQFRRKDIIYPDDHFKVEIFHPIIQELGIHDVVYRLFSYEKANAGRFNGNGWFGEKIKFDYIVRERC